MDQGVTRRGGDTIMRVVLLCTAMLVAALLFVSLASATTLYVDQTAPGPTHDGLSWATAFLKIGDAVYSVQIDEKVLVMTRFHLEVKTWYFTSFSCSSSMIRAWIIFSG